MSEEYLVPTGYGEAELIEKRSRFIGRIWRCETEAEALAALEQIRQQHWDASHNVYAYCIHGGATRFSDDGEPGGTAGMPVLEVLRREGLENVLCVVTRYFGGILLGAGGLVRAYARSAKLAVDAAGISRKQIWRRLDVPCSYRLMERMKQELETQGGQVLNIDYGAEVTIRALLPKSKMEACAARLVDVSNGTVTPLPGDEAYQAFPVRAPRQPEE